MVRFLRPMRGPQTLYKPFTAAGWVYELKHDGFRCMAGVDPGAVELRTKTLRECTRSYPEVVGALAKLPGGPHLIDGEVCVLRPDGTSDFNAFHTQRGNRTRVKPGAPPVTFMAFDLLIHGGENITARPLEERKERLEGLLASLPKAAVMYVGMLPAEADLFAAMVAAGLEIEGVIAKRRGSTYQPGVRSDDWRKIKRPGWNEGREWRG